MVWRVQLSREERCYNLDSFMLGYDRHALAQQTGRAGCSFAVERCRLVYICCGGV